MSSDTIRIAMWSGPRNISTAMMRAFENRPDTGVVDEPFYAAYLKLTGVDHPMRAEVLAHYSSDWRKIVEELVGPAPGGRPIFYQKHMTHHMVPEIGRDWIMRCRNAFLIRAPEAVLASYSARRADVTLADIGFVEQRELFEREADRLGIAPPVIDGEDVLADPRAALTALCAALGIGFSDHMLQWPVGRRATDGIWAPIWYDAVERSTAFKRPLEAGPAHLSEHLNTIADGARPHYQRLASFRLLAPESPNAEPATRN